MHFGTDKKFYYQTAKESESKFETVAGGEGFERTSSGRQRLWRQRHPQNPLFLTVILVKMLLR